MPSPRHLIAAALLGAATGAMAGPVDAEAAAADPYELAMRWTLASLSPSELAPLPAPSAAPIARLVTVPHAGAPSGVPEPAGYALMGLLLLGAGLLAQRMSGPRTRGPKRV